MRNCRIHPIMTYSNDFKYNINILLWKYLPKPIDEESGYV